MPITSSTPILFLLFLLALVAAAPVERDHHRQSTTTASFWDNVVTDQRELQQAGQITIPEWDSGEQYFGESAGIDMSFNHVLHNTQGPTTGISYYLRAFDVFPRWYTRQFGWGQWITPELDKQNQNVCARNPRRVVCSDVDQPFFDPSTEGPVQDCSWPQGDDRLLACEFGTCGDEEQKIWGTFEGGMGYWPHSTGASGAKWSSPAGVSGDYFDKFGGTFLNDFRQPCTHLGGVIQIANNILWTTDMFSFEQNPAKGQSDGMLGYMMQRTPIGKMGENDNRNYWTVVVDADNFAGPLAYTSAYFWEHPNSWHPDVKTWSDPQVKIGDTVYGVEGDVGTVAVEKDGFYYYRMQDVQFPLDDSGDSFTFASGHSEYYTDWAMSVLEPILDGSRQNAVPSDIVAAARAAGTKPVCLEREVENDFHGEFAGEFRISKDEASDPSNSAFTVTGWGIGNDRSPDTGAEDAWCRNRLPVDTANPATTCDAHKCRLSPYFRIPVNARGQDVVDGEIIPEDQMPADVKQALDDRMGQWDEPSRQNDSRYIDGPVNHEKACFDQPGPADDTLYCRRTSDERWLGYRWYRFVDQPEMNQVFAALPEQEQMGVKCYMQSRIERLHAMQEKENVPRWFDAPGDLPTEKVKFDEGFLVTPPVGFERGYVPVVIFSKIREKPNGCIVDKGVADEPRPVPSNYYDSAVAGGGYALDPEMCRATPESGDDYKVNEIVYLTKRDGSGEKYPYNVPLRSEVAATLPAAFSEDQCAISVGTPTTAVPTPTVAPTQVVTPVPTSNLRPTTIPTETSDDDAQVTLQIEFGFDTEDVEILIRTLVPITETPEVVYHKPFDAFPEIEFANEVLVETITVKVSVVYTLIVRTRSGASGIISYSLYDGDSVESAKLKFTDSFVDDFAASNFVAEVSENQPTAAPTVAPTPASVNICFSGNSAVYVQGRGMVPLMLLQIGDMVHVGKGKYESIYSFGHYRLDATAEFLKISTSKSMLEISDTHMLRVKSYGFVPASRVQVGDTLFDGNDNELLVNSITVVQSIGVFAPFTASGHVIVNDIQVSSFVALGGNAAATLTIGGVDFSHQWLAHSFELPHRLVCYYFGTCPGENYDENGVSDWVAAPMRISLWVVKQHFILKNLLLLVALPVLTLFAAIEAVLLLVHPLIAVIACGIIAVFHFRVNSKST